MPTSFVAVRVNVYSVSFTRLLIVQVVAAHVVTTPPGEAVT